MKLLKNLIAYDYIIWPLIFGLTLLYQMHLPPHTYPFLPIWGCFLIGILLCFGASVFGDTQAFFYFALIGLSVITIVYGTLINEQYSWLPMIAATNGYVLFPKAIIKYYDMQLWYLLWRVRMLKDHEKNYLLANERFFKNENVTLEGFFVFEKTDEYVTFEKYLLKEVKIEKLLFQDKNAWETLRKGSSSMQLPITNVLHKLVDCINDQRQIRRDKNNFLATKNVTEFTKNIIAGREATFLRKWGFASWQ